MGERTPKPSFSSAWEDRRRIGGSTELPAPPQVLVRWAALAAERSSLGILPRQAGVHV